MNEQRTASITVKVTPEFKEWIKELAIKDGRSISTLMVKAAEMWAKMNTLGGIYQEKLAEEIRARKTEE